MKRVLGVAALLGIVLSLPLVAADKSRGHREAARAGETEVPTDPQKIEALRQRLRELEERRIELLSPATLIEEISAQESDVLERQSWKRLQEVRQLLDAISAEFPETKAGHCARNALGAIPDAEEPTRTALQPTPITGVSSGPTPIKGI